VSRTTPVISEHSFCFLSKSSGICYEITKQLLLHGCIASIICGRREDFLQKASAELASTSGKICLYKVCDVRDETACKVDLKFTRTADLIFLNACILSLSSVVRIGRGGVRNVAIRQGGHPREWSGG
jgi:NADP-dependent 3-hydroxy acid dehydrogenase YdfG